MNIHNCRCQNIRAHDLLCICVCAILMYIPIFRNICTVESCNITEIVCMLKYNLSPINILPGIFIYSFQNTNFMNTFFRAPFH